MSHTTLSDWATCEKNQRREKELGWLWSCMWGKYFALRSKLVPSTIACPNDGPAKAIEPKSSFFSTLITEQQRPNLVQERPGGDAQRPTATQTNGDRHAGWIPRRIDGLAKALGELGCPTKSVSLLEGRVKEWAMERDDNPCLNWYHQSTTDTVEEVEDFYLPCISTHSSTSTAPMTTYTPAPHDSLLG